MKITFSLLVLSIASAINAMQPAGKSGSDYQKPTLRMAVIGLSTATPILFRVESPIKKIRKLPLQLHGYIEYGFRNFSFSESQINTVINGVDFSRAKIRTQSLGVNCVFSLGAFSIAPFWGQRAITAGPLSLNKGFSLLDFKSVGSGKGRDLGVRMFCALSENFQLGITGGYSKASLNNDDSFYREFIQQSSSPNPYYIRVSPFRFEFALKFGF